MRQLTAEELAESDVEFYVFEGTVLPEDVRKMLELYIGIPVVSIRTGEIAMCYRIPAYLAREWLERYDAVA